MVQFHNLSIFSILVIIFISNFCIYIAINSREESAQDSRNSEESNEVYDNSNLININDSISSKYSLDTQQNENVAIDSQHILAVENTIDGESLQNSSLGHDIFTNPMLSMEIIQESEQIIVFSRINHHPT